MCVCDLHRGPLQQWCAARGHPEPLPPAGALSPQGSQGPWTRWGPGALGVPVSVSTLQHLSCSLPPQPGSLVSFKAPGWGGFPGHPPWLVESPDPWAEGHTPGKPQMPHHGRFKPLSSQDHEAHGLGVWQLCGRCLPRTQEPCWIPLGQEALPCPSINGFPGSGKQAAGSLCPVPSTSALQLPTKTG